MRGAKVESGMASQWTALRAWTNSLDPYVRPYGLMPGRYTAIRAENGVFDLLIARILLIDELSSHTSSLLAS